MKSLKIFLIAAITTLSLYSCSDTTAQNNVTVSHPQPQDINVQSNDIPGFNVNRFADLLKTTSNPYELTQAINSTGNDINNLDLNNDGQIDYLKVDQIDNSSLAVYDETTNGKVEICKLTVNTQNNSYSVVGSPQYCGNTYVYHSPPGLTLGQFMFLHWMLTPRPYFYHPTWGYGVGYYGGYRPYTRTYTRTRTVTSPSYTRTTRSTPTQVRSNTSSYRSTTQPTTQRTSINNPVRSQREFQRGEGKRYNSSGATGSGFRSSSVSRSGFGSSRSSSFGSSRSSSRSSSFGSSRSSSRSSFGSSRSSFGSSRSSGRRR